MAEENVDRSKQQPLNDKPAEKAKSSTTPIKPVVPASPGEKTATSRINLSSATPPSGGVPSSSRAAPENPKKSTSRVNIPTGQMTQMTAADKSEAIKKTTVRVQLEDIKKGDTQQILAARAASGDAKQKTSQINLNEVLGDDQDIFKRRTTLLDASKFVPGGSATSSIPRTIRIKQSDGQPASGVPKSAEEGPSQVAPMPSASIETSKKSETARIELPAGVGSTEDVPPTRRKTIRIRRPEGGPGSRPMVFNQTSEVGVTQIKSFETKTDDEPGVVFVALAAVASLLVIGLIAVQVMALNSFGTY
ncbi:MAG TPA: hypothetical protein DCZ95_02070 [Verrucomicrobia bacterium]|nr:MAG: hypothetical protein A2X46_00775 [Lentisphaerae bacterium GWF2_57_35]HBA82857.1 hypothetical protein [Verrucomicrobiota bacterium]